MHTLQWTSDRQSMEMRDHYNHGSHRKYRSAERELHETQELGARGCKSLPHLPRLPDRHKPNSMAPIFALQDRSGNSARALLQTSAEAMNAKRVRGAEMACKKRPNKDSKWLAESGHATGMLEPGMDRGPVLRSYPHLPEIQSDSMDSDSEATNLWFCIYDAKNIFGLPMVMGSPKMRKPSDLFALAEVIGFAKCEALRV